MLEQFNTETEFLQTMIDRLNIDTYAWSEMSQDEREKLLTVLKRLRPNVVVLNP